MTEQILIAVGSGSLDGFALGLVGGGDSILATPLLLYAVGIAQPHIAIGTGALAVSVNAYANLIGHARRGHVRWTCAIVFALVGSVGALVGSTLGKAMDGQRLLFLFGLLMLVVGVLMLRPRKNAPAVPKPVDLRMCLLTGSVAIVAGGASGFFGIGGGFLIVPGLILATGMRTIDAVGSSLLAVGTFGLATALNYESAPARDGIEQPAGQEKRDQHRRGVEIDMRRTGYEANDGEREGAAGTQRDQKVHARRAQADRAQSHPEDARAGPEDDGQREHAGVRNGEFGLKAGLR